MKSAITTHVLDTYLGKPAANIPVIVEQESGKQWIKIGEGLTNKDGRIPDLIPITIALRQGQYRIHFALSQYFVDQSRKYFYPRATIDFFVDDPNQHYHVPLLLSGFGFSTYRGS